MEIKMSCPCGATVKITGNDTYTQSQADKWREQHAGCPKLKFDYKAALDRGTYLDVKHTAPSEPLVGDVKA